jgi:PKD repeat protein
MEAVCRILSRRAAPLVPSLLLVFATTLAAGAQPLSRIGGVHQVSPSGYTPSVAAATDGFFMVVWREGSSIDGRIFGRMYGPGAVPVGSAFRIDQVFAAAAPWVAALPAGYVVVWLQDDGVRTSLSARLFSKAGAPVGEEIVVDGEVEGLNGFPIAEGRPDGGFVVAWGQQWEGIQVRLYDASGGALTQATPTGLGWLCHSLSVAADGSFVVAGNSHTLFASRFDAGGRPAGEPFQISPSRVLNDPNVLADQDHCPTVHLAADGSMMATWHYTHVELVGPSFFRGQVRSFETPEGPGGAVNDLGPAFVGLSWTGGSESTLLDASGDGFLALEGSELAPGNTALRLYSRNGVPLSRQFELQEIHSPSGVSLATTGDGDVLVVGGNGGGGIRLHRFSIGESVAPRAAFDWSPLEPAAGEEIAFHDRSVGSPAAWSWDFDGDGIEDSSARVPIHQFSAPGPHPVSLVASTAYGSDRVTRTVMVEPVDDRPYVTSVRRQFPGYFLEGTALSNTFEVEVDWRGSPGTVSFSVDGGAETVVAAAGEVARHDFAMGADFSPSFGPSSIILTPTNGEGVTGSPFEEPVFVFPYPSWLQAALALGHEGGMLGVEVVGGEVVWSVAVQHPEPPLAARLEVPAWVPVFGGPLGLEETYYALSGTVSSRGEGSLGVGGQLRFRAGDDTLSGKAQGRGSFRLAPPDGFRLTGASVRLDLAGTLAKPLALTELPGIEAAGSLPVVGGKIRRIAESGRLLGEISPHLGAQVALRQEQGDLRFDSATGTLGLDLRAVFEVKPPGDRLELRGWVGGGGSFTIGVPEPYLRAFEGHLEVGGRLRLDALFEVDAMLGARFTCGWTAEGGTSCVDDSEETAGLRSGADATASSRVSVLGPEYARHGAYAAPAREPARRPVAAAAGDGTAEVVVENVFPGASPRLVEAEGYRLLLWEHQDLGDPVLQSTEIAWSVDDGAGWSLPETIADDTRVELSPVAGVDAEGRLVAAWLRVADEAFSEVVDEVSDLGSFYSRLDVVTAVYDPAARAWTTPVPLTADQVLDTDLHLAASEAGDLLLTWLSNPGSELQATPDDPSSLMYSFWDAAASSWTAPAAIGGGMIGVGSHAPAIAGAQEALVVVSSDQDPAVVGDDSLETYRWDGSLWSGPSALASEAGEHRAPAAAFDAEGTAHVVWFHDGALVHATDDRPTTSMGETLGNLLPSLQLLASPDGTLALLAQEIRDGGPATASAWFFDAAAESWSDAIALHFEEEVLHRELGGEFGEAGELGVTLLATQVERVEEEVVLGGEPVRLTNLPRDGRTDLLALRHPLHRNLTVVSDTLEIGPARPRPGDAVSVVFDVANTGDLAVLGFAVDLRVGSPDSSGVLGASVPIAGPVAAGASVPFEVLLTWPAAEGALFVIVDPLDEVAESSEQDNVAVRRIDDAPPTAVAVADVTRGPAPLSVAFDGSESFGDDAGPLTHRWSFGDGSTATTGARVSHVFAEPGIYPVTLTVTDPSGGMGRAGLSVTVDGPGCALQPDLRLTRQLVTSRRSFEACSTIETGEGFGIEASGDVLFRAGDSVVLGNGFGMAEGASLRVLIDPSLRISP